MSELQKKFYMKGLYFVILKTKMNFSRNTSPLPKVESKVWRQKELTKSDNTY